MKITYAYPRFTFEAHLILNAVVPKEWYVGHLAKSDIESRHNFEDKIVKQIFWRGRAEPACLWGFAEPQFGKGMRTVLSEDKAQGVIKIKDINIIVIYRDVT